MADVAILRPIQIDLVLNRYFQGSCYNNHAKGKKTSFIVINIQGICFHLLLWRYLATCTSKWTILYIDVLRWCDQLKGIGGPLLLVLWAFYNHRVRIALQRAQASSILKQVVIVNEASSKLGTLCKFLLLSLSNCFMLLARGLRPMLRIQIGAFSQLLGVILAFDVGPLFVFLPLPFGVVLLLIKDHTSVVT